MQTLFRSAAVAFLGMLSVLALALGATLGAAPVLAESTALIMGGTGRPNPDDFPGYVPNVMNYYINPRSSCGTVGCTPEAVETPETAWPVYGGLSALTWKQSILQGSELFHAAVLERLASDDEKIILFGYSQSGAIIALEKQKLAAENLDTSRLEIVLIGNVSRPNGGLNGRLPITIPIVQFPYGPTVPKDPSIPTTDIAFKWDIIADAPTYITNAVALTNALLGFWYVHGTYPDPTEADPNSWPGGYSPTIWQDMMDNPLEYPDVIDFQQDASSNTTYLTVTPTVLPLVRPLYDLGLKSVADLVEPLLRVIVEWGYDRSIPYGTATPFKLTPFNINPIKATSDVIAAIGQGVRQFITDITGGGSNNRTAGNAVSATNQTTAAANVVSTTETAVDQQDSTDESDQAEPTTLSRIGAAHQPEGTADDATAADPGSSPSETDDDAGTITDITDESGETETTPAQDETDSDAADQDAADQDATDTDTGTGDQGAAQDTDTGTDQAASASSGATSSHEESSADTSADKAA